MWHKSLLLFVFTLLMVSGISFGAEDLSPEENLAETAWQKFDKTTDGLMWQLRLTPPMPCDLEKSQNICRFAYASGRDPKNLRDAEVIAKPWARLEGTTLTKLSKKLVRIAKQGVTPLKKEDLAIYAEERSAQETIFKLAKKEDISVDEMTLAKKYYCLWFRNNGVISAELAKPLSPFISWLDCTK